MQKRILITGAAGQVGSEIRFLSNSYPYDFVFLEKEDLDITDLEALSQMCEINQITNIINCASLNCADKAQAEPNRADKTNHIGAKNIAICAMEFGINVIHISTDYVFDGNAFLPYTETDKTNPLSTYGQTKLDGEEAIIDIAPPNSIIIRSSWIYSSFGRNFVKDLIKVGSEEGELNMVFDKIGTPTYARSLAKTILDILPKIHNEKVEIYHYSNEGSCSWYDFAQEVVELASLKCTIKPTRTIENPTHAVRPNYSILDKTKIKNTFRVQINYWKEDLKSCITSTIDQFK